MVPSEGPHHHNPPMGGPHVEIEPHIVGSSQPLLLKDGVDLRPPQVPGRPKHHGSPCHINTHKQGQGRWQDCGGRSSHPNPGLAVGCLTRVELDVW